MITINYSTFRKNLKSFLDKVNLDSIPVVINRAKGKDVVVMSKADYDSMEETFYLLKSPANASRLLTSIEDIEKGNISERELIEE